MNISSNYIIIGIGLIAGFTTFSFGYSDKETVLGFPVYFLFAIAGFLGSFILRMKREEKSYKIALLVSLGIVVALVIRIFYDGLFTPNSHNLFPIEIIICLFIALPATFIGSYLDI